MFTYRRIIPPLLDVLLILRANIDLYPPSRNQANLLAYRGLRVGVIDLSYPRFSQTELDASVWRWQPHSLWDSKQEAPRPSIIRIIQYLRFKAACRVAIQSAKPAAVLGYDLMGCLNGPPLPDKYVTLYHFHELFRLRPHGEWRNQISHNRIRYNLSKASRFTISDRHRGEMQRQEALLSRPPETIINCPLKMDSIPRSRLRENLSRKGLYPDYVVGYIGSIGEDQGVLETAASMAYWPDNTLFVLVGNVSDKIRTSLCNTAAKTGRGKDLLFMGPKPHTEAFSLIAGADIGVSLIQGNGRNWTYSAGAINKRFEYAALGLPQVTSDLPGVMAIFEDAAVYVRGDDVIGIGNSIRGLLLNPERRRQIGEKARKLHLQRYHYEAQFGPFGDWIEMKCRQQRYRQRHE